MSNLLLALSIVSLLIIFAVVVTILMSIHWWFSIVFVFAVTTPIIYMIVKDTRGK